MHTGDDGSKPTDLSAGEIMIGVGLGVLAAIGASVTDELADSLYDAVEVDEGDG